MATGHIIEDISYSKDFILCVCGWRGKVDDFQPHKKDNPIKEDLSYVSPYDTENSAFLTAQKRKKVRRGKPISVASY